MLTVYGTKICPDCIACEASFKKYGINYRFVNIFASMPKMKAFIQLRDTNPVFDHLKAVHDLGIPACVKEDGTVFTDWEGYLREQGFEPIWPAEADEAMEKIKQEKAAAGAACGVGQQCC